MYKKKGRKCNILDERIDAEETRNLLGVVIVLDEASRPEENQTARARSQPIRHHPFASTQHWAIPIELADVN